MNDDDIKGLTEAELAQHIEQLEGQDWLKELRSLQAHSDQQSLYQLGLLAGRAESHSRSGLAASLRVAALSALVSMAATVFVMLQLSPDIVRSTAETTTATKDIPRIGRSGNVQSDNVQSDKVQSRPQADVGTTTNQVVGKELDIDALLAARQHESHLLPEVDSDDNTSNVRGKAFIKSESLRYVTQRRDWLTQLNSSVPD